MAEMSKILFDSRPLTLSIELAVVLGLNEAIVIQQIHYWLESARKAKRNKRNGRTWTYNTYSQWQEQFPFWSKATIKRIFTSLENKGIVLSGNFNKNPYNKTKWYSLDYEQLEQLFQPENESDEGLGYSQYENSSSCNSRWGQNELIENDWPQEGPWDHINSPYSTPPEERYKAIS